MSRSIRGCQTTCTATSPQFAMQSWGPPLVGNDAKDLVLNGRLVIKLWVESWRTPGGHSCQEEQIKVP